MEILSNIKRKITNRSQNFTLTKNAMEEFKKGHQFEFAYLKTNYSLYEVTLVSRLIQNRTIPREIIEKDSMLFDNKFLFGKYNITSRKGSGKVRIEVNYLYAIIPLIYTDMEQIYDPQSSIFPHNEIFYITNLFSGLIVNCISVTEYQFLIQTLKKDKVLKEFIENSEYEDNLNKFRMKIISLLYNIYYFIDEHKSKYNDVVLKSVSDFRFIYYINDKTHLKEIIDEFVFTVDFKGTVNLILPKVFTDSSLIQTHYEQIFKVPKRHKPIMKFEREGYSENVTIAN